MRNKISTRFIIGLLFTIVSNSNFANIEVLQIDSLKLELQQSTNDSIKYSVCTDLAYKYENIDFDTAEQYYNQAIDIAMSNEWYRKVGNCYFNKSFYYHYNIQSDTAFLMLNEAQKWYTKANYSIGVLSCYFTTGTYKMNIEEFDSATFYLETAVTYGDTLNDSIYLHKSYNNLGLLYHYLGFYDKGIENFIKAIHLKEELNTPDASSACVNLGLSYNTNGQKEEAIFYYNKALTAFREQKNQAGEALCLTNIGEVYSNNNIDSAIYYYNQAYSIFEVLNDSNSMARSHNSKAGIYHEQNKHEQAISEYKQALKMVPSNGLKRLQTSIINNYSSLRLELLDNNKNDIQEIIQLAKKSHRLSTESGLIQAQSIAALILFQAYSQNKQFEKAFPFGNEYIELNDSLNNQTRIDALAEQLTRFKTEKNELEIDLLNKENELKTNEIDQNNILKSKQQLIIYLLIAGVLTITIFFGIILTFFRKQQVSNKELEKRNQIISTQKEEKDILLKEIHHRVKNNLQIIWSLLDLQSNSINDIHIKDAINDGKNRVSSMATIHQMLYQNDDAGNISFDEYIRKLIQQIMSTHSHAKDIDLTIQIPKDLKFDIDTSIPLGLIVTELFTNALKYGTNTSSPGAITILLQHIEEKNYQLTIKDNGKGLPDHFKIITSKSLGLRLVKNLSKQIKGEFIHQNNDGAEFIIKFMGTSFSVN
jgi:two-component sensor histidine kinase/Tfp pilus assembly protein PilF